MSADPDILHQLLMSCMHFHHSSAEVFIPDNLGEAEGLARITHLGIGAHQDDLEFMAFHGILACYQEADQWFGGVTCTNGAGSARTGAYAHLSDQQMQVVRRKEQNQAARIGRYGAMIQLDYPSAAVKDRQDADLRDDLLTLLRATKPKFVYTHNLADKHATHIGVAIASIQAIRALPAQERPEKVYGCEVWRDLDWLPDSEKVVQNLGGHEALAAALNGVFDSQIAGGKRYDLGVIGRRRANATFFNSHAVDQSESVAFAMDLTPLVREESMDIIGYVDRFIMQFRNDVISKLQSRLGVVQ